MQNKKPRDRILFTATLSYDWLTGLLYATGNPAPVSAVEVRAIETWAKSWSKSDQYIPRLDFEQITQRDRFGAPTWEAARLPAAIFYALLYEIRDVEIGEGTHLLIDGLGCVKRWPDGVDAAGNTK